jgi:hypothetical protein
MSGDIPITVLKFELVVEQERQGEANPRPLEQEQIPIQNVFASYASEDRVDVLQWTRGAEFAGVNVFLDVLTLREGAAWETELQRHVPTKDLFCLFWSAPASRSRWVEMEWQCALATRGLDYIHPVALADPRVVPPPEQLRSRQFSDVSFVVREYEKGVQSDGSRNASSDHT